MNSFLLLFDNKLNSVTTGWEELQGRTRVPGLGGRVKCEECPLLSAAGSSDPFGTSCHSESPQSCRKGTDVTNRENIPERCHVLKLLEVLLLLKQVLAYFTRTTVATWLSVLAVKEHLLHLVTCGCSYSWVSNPSSLPPVSTNQG